MSHYVRFWLQSWQKVMIWAQTFFAKMHNSMLTSHLKTVKNVMQKKLPTKLRWKSSVLLIILCANVFGHNFFWVNCPGIFQRIQNRHQILRLWKPILNFCEKKKLGLISALFANFEAEITRNSSYNKNVCYKCVLKLNFASKAALVSLLLAKK